MNINYRKDIDLLKGVAILAVVLYHAGVTQCGYLGVDAFFVINGFLIVPKVVEQITNESFSYSRFLEKRIFRLLPLLLLISAVSLTIGFWGMAPQDLRYLSESVIATNFFCNNVLQAVTTQNYWAAIYHNIMMHTWFVGILMQFYVLFPLILLLTKWTAKKWHWPIWDAIVAMLILLTAVSLTIYLLPLDSSSNKFYLLHYRFFELGIGGMAGIYLSNRRQPTSFGPLSDIVFIFWSILIIFSTPIFFSQDTPFNLISGTNYYYDCNVPKSLLLIATVVLTLILLVHGSDKRILHKSLIRARIFNLFGKMSYSIFLLHQPILAFYRYFFTDQLTLTFFLWFGFFLLFLSALTYYYLEQRIRLCRTSRIVIFVSFFIINGLALYAHNQTNAISKAYEAYTDRIYQYDKDFSPTETKTKVLIIGNSFARDFANILLESPIRDSISLSYHYDLEHLSHTRIQQADRIYYFGWKHNLPQSFWESLNPHCQVYGIGPKNFGSSIGRIYKYRHCNDYHSRSVSIDPNFFVINDALKKEWGDHFIDLLSPFILPDSTVRPFTPDNALISFDGYHLTEEGAIHYARLFGGNDRLKQLLP